MYSWKQNGGKTLNAHKSEIKAMSENSWSFLDRKLNFSPKMGHGISSWNKVGGKTLDSRKFEIKGISEKKNLDRNLRFLPKMGLGIYIKIIFGGKTLNLWFFKSMPYFCESGKWAENVNINDL